MQKAWKDAIKALQSGNAGALCEILYEYKQKLNENRWFSWYIRLINYIHGCLYYPIAVDRERNLLLHLLKNINACAPADILHQEQIVKINRGCLTGLLN